MSQHDMNIANQGFPAFRSDLNDALSALATTSAGTAEPSTTFANQLWYDSTNDLLKMRNSDNDAWITLAYFDQTADEWQLRSAAIQAVDAAGVQIKTDEGTTRIDIQDDGDISFNSGDVFIDSSGDVGIGTSSPNISAGASGSTALTVSASTANDSNRNGLLELRGTRSATGNVVSYVRTFNNSGATPITDIQSIRGASDTTGSLLFRTSNSDAMRIDSSGNLLVNSSTNVGTADHKVSIQKGSSGRCLGLGTTVTTNTVMASFVNGNGTVGTINTSGSATIYGTSSDYRLKEDWVPMSDSIARVKALNPVNFAWKADGTRVDGFLAHEAQEIVPEAVTGEKDAMRTEEYEVSPAVLDEDGNVVTEAVMGTREVPDYQGIDQSKLVPLLTAALQEAIAKIEALEARVTALES